mmetsp:Transcript_12312/g.16128  ORF Transcript_12312/g.16128 Transcript_12312/m.16128 type:complete len:662 (+) Transcript_12312:123-2108(+)
MTTLDHRLILLSHGNFNPIESDSEEDVPQAHLNLNGKIVKEEADLILNKKVEKEEKLRCTTVNVGGTRVDISDYHISWENNENKLKGEDRQLSTHEITYDDVNGFDKGFAYVSGFATNQIARVNIEDPTKQQFFRFVLKDTKLALPHTLLFANKTFENEHEEVGMLWVGLEYAGLIVKLDMRDLIRKLGNKTVCTITEDDLKAALDVRITGDSKNGSLPSPINTHPHGFCFDKDYKNIWFTGKLTNTVGRVRIEDGDVKHYELPTIEAVPIYLALDVDGNVWGTCLANNRVFRVTTGAKEGQTEGCVTEIPITSFPTQRRPIALKKDPRDKRYMWFSTEVGHSVCRIDINKLDEVYPSGNTRSTGQQEHDQSSTCMCSQGCQKTYKSPARFKGVITEFSIPGEQNMVFGGLAFDREGSLWVQSYYNNANGLAGVPTPSDYIIKVDKAILERNHGFMAGIPVASFEVPSKTTVLHRIICGPNDGEMLFTELANNRIGKVSISYHGSASGSSNNSESPGPPITGTGTPVEEVQEPIRQDEASSPSSSQLYKRRFEVKDIGKNIKQTKKQVTWVFEQEGSNPHSIVMVWSKRSGKVQIEMDSTQVLPEQALTKPRAQYIEHSWTDTQSGLRMQILANRTTRSTMLGCSKYELRVNEMPFQNFPR